MAQEYPSWHIYLYDVDKTKSPPSESFVPLIQRAKTSLINGEIKAERNGFCYTRRLERLHFPQPSRETFRHRGVYVLVGGAGHLGRRLTEHLVKKYQAEIIWLGRQTAYEQMQEKLEVFGKGGTQPLYYAINDWSGEEVQQIFKEIKKKKKVIHGVFNLVMVSEGGGICSLDEEQFRAQSFEAKAKSAVGLYHALKAESLDFLVFFSSMQSFSQRLSFMSIKMSSYVSGCMFQDAFVHTINKQVDYPVKTINWGYWSRGTEADAEGNHKNQEAFLNSQGVYALQVDEGMDALEVILCHDLKQVVVVKASDELLTQMGVLPDRHAAIIPDQVKDYFHKIIPALPDRSFYLQNILSQPPLEHCLGGLMFQGVVQGMDALNGFSLMREGCDIEEARKQLNVLDKYHRL